MTLQISDAVMRDQGKKFDLLMYKSLFVWVNCNSQPLSVCRYLLICGVEIRLLAISP